MSGIVGILNKSGAPVDRALLQALTQFLAYRGPDGREVWALGAVGFGHTMLRATRESLNERQPMGLDGRFWITADARIDRHGELRADLENKGRKLSRVVTDAELILHAYAVWKDDCVLHLRGDFSFAIWDIRERKLFCARDHFGIKPFYYAEIGETFIFSNTLNCVRLHPLVADELNNAAILDFLLAGMNWNNATTTFRDVRRLPPAHTLTITAEGSRVQSYWGLPIDGRIRYQNPTEYVEHFQTLLQEAVSDRMRDDRLGVFLSGGMDSSSIAAAAQQLADSNTKLRAYTAVSESPEDDSEGRLAKEVAGYLEIPIQFYRVDGLEPFERPHDRRNSWPEPVDDPFFAQIFDEFRMIAPHCRAVFNGEGNDALMSFEMTPYARDLWRRREWGELLTSIVRFFRVRRFPTRGILARAQGFFGKGPTARAFPDWISASLASPSQVKDRWHEITAGSSPRRHPVVPLAYDSLALSSWTQLFEGNDPGVTRFPVEVRYPFLDLRMVAFLLAIPPFPWFYEKALLRRATAGRLPQQILARPKTPLAEDPLVAHLQLPGAAAIDKIEWCEGIEGLVDLGSVPKLAGERSDEKARAGIRPRCLNFWLQYSRPVRYNLVAEAVNG